MFHTADPDCMHAHAAVGTRSSHLGHVVFRSDPESAMDHVH